MIPNLFLVNISKNNTTFVKLIKKKKTQVINTGKERGDITIDMPHQKILRNSINKIINKLNK